LNNAKEITKDWNSAGFDSSEADMGNDFLSQIDLFVNDFTVSCGDKLSKQEKDAVTESIASSLLSIFIWLPYNIFEGPSDRSDDPARTKEEKGCWKIKESKNQQKDTSLLEKSLNLNNLNQISAQGLESNKPLDLGEERFKTPEKSKRNLNSNSDSQGNKTKSYILHKNSDNSSNINLNANSDSKHNKTKLCFFDENLDVDSKNTSKYNTPKKVLNNEFHSTIQKNHKNKSCFYGNRENSSSSNLCVENRPGNTIDSPQKANNKHFYRVI